MYNNKNVKELKAIARSRKIKGYYKMRKAELISVLSPKVKLVIKRKPHIEKPKVKLLIKPLPLLDEPVPHIERPILQPTREVRDVSSLKELSSRVAQPVKKEINKITNWILNKVPKSLKKEGNERITALKEKIDKIFNKTLPLLDEPVPHIERPILQPTRELRDVSSPKELASSVARPVKKKINEFLDWITSPNVRKEALKEKKSLSALKEKINRIFDKEKKELTPKLQQTALYGYLKNYRISGKEKNLS